MTPDEIGERTALAGLGVLDGAEREPFERILRESLGARRETEAFLRVAERLGLAVAPVVPPPRVRDLVLSGARPRLASKGRHPMTVLATAAAVLFAIGFFLMRAERDDARRGEETAREQAELALGQAHQAQAEVLAARESLARETAFRMLVSHPEARLVDLRPLPPAPKARGRVLFNPASHEGVLIASGLDPLPEGKGYEVWAIGQAAPVPAGVFQVDALGNAVHRLPALAAVGSIRSFAVTLEPAVGVPAPTGPMVLAGAVS